MRILPGLTSTDRSAIEIFLRELRSSTIREIAFFPTCLDRTDREALYRELEGINGLSIPHVHLRGDMGVDEIGFLRGAFGSELFNVHSRASSHPYTADAGEFKLSIFIENADKVPGPEELVGFGGLCIDYSHWASGKLIGDVAYDGFEELAATVKIGCCHISALRPGVRSKWGGFDHHRFTDPTQIDYALDFKRFFPESFASLELENGLYEQLEAAERLG